MGFRRPRFRPRGAGKCARPASDPRRCGGSGFDAIQAAEMAGQCCRVASGVWCAPRLAATRTMRVRQELARRRDRWSLIRWDHARRLHCCGWSARDSAPPHREGGNDAFVRRHETVRTQARFEKVRWQTRVAPTLRQEGASSNPRSLQADSSRLQLSVGSLSYANTHLYRIVVTAPHHETVRNRCANAVRFARGP